MQTLPEYLSSKKIRRDKFAALVPTTEATLSRWCTGASKPSDENKARIEKITEGAVPVTAWFPEIADGVVA